MTTVPGCDRPVAQRRGERQGQRQVEARLAHDQAAGEVGVDVVAGQADSGAPAEDRDEERRAGWDRCRWPSRAGVP